jgi:hypothetical protein
MGGCVIFLGGNGHCAARLAPARAALTRIIASGDVAPFVLADVGYPGCEDRPRAPDFTSFLEQIGRAIAEFAEPRDPTIIYGTGIGALLALCLRSRGLGPDLSLLMQGPVLWGLERRLMPRLMRLGLARTLLGRLFQSGWFQCRFVRKQFQRPLPHGMREAFFAGYRQCAALADFFHWLTPGLLRELERRFAARPGSLERIGLWWGGRDHVVDLQELAWTKQALHVDWPLRLWPAWGHYPMIDEPEEWVRSLSDVLAAPEALPGPIGAEAR